MTFDYREWTLARIENGMLSADELAQMVVRWMTDDDLGEMLSKNEIGPQECDRCECVIVDKDDSSTTEDPYGELCDECYQEKRIEDFLDENNADDRDMEKLKTDIENDNFDIDYDDPYDYDHDNLVMAAINNGQFADAREMCDDYGLDFEDYHDTELTENQ